MKNTEPIELFSPCYKGKRFDDHRLPVDFCSDLLALKKMTIEMAKEIYLKENPEKKRIPKNFEKDISIELEGIEQGSTIPKLVLITILTTLFPENQDYFVRAPEKIKHLIETAHLDEDISGSVPNSVLACFDQLGRNLRDDETIIFEGPQKSKIVYNKEIRKKLLMAKSDSKEYKDSCELRGKITALDKVRKTFDLQLSKELKIKGTYASSDLSVIQEALVKLEEDQKIWLRGIGLFNHSDKLQSIESIEEISLLDSLDVQTRLEELSALPNGWLDGEQGISLDTEALKWLGETFDNNFNSDVLPLPATYPTPMGNIQFEWSFDKNEISLEVNLSTKKAEFYSVHTQTHKEITKSLDLNTVEGWQKLDKELRALHGK